jgi:dephospho-CoA kinase
MLVDRFSTECVAGINFSDAITTVLDVFDVPRQRRDYDDFATALRGTSYGPDIFRRAIKKKIHMARREEIIDILIVSGARFIDDLAVVPRDQMKVVAVVANEEVRYERALRSKKDNIKSIEEFRAADNATTEGEVGVLLLNADDTLRNDSSLDRLRAQISHLDMSN